MIKLLLLPLFFIGSCSQLPISYADTPLQIYRAAFGYPNEAVSQEIYESYEYSFAKVRFGKGQSAIMILAAVKNDIYTWVGNDGVKIITINGRIVETDGLPNDVDIFHSPQRKGMMAGRFFEVINFENPILSNANLESSVQFDDYEDYQYLENSLKALIFSEIISIRSIGWKEQNYYYFNSQNKALKTIQSIHPFLDKIEMEFYLK